MTVDAFPSCPPQAVNRHDEPPLATVTVLEHVGSLSGDLASERECGAAGGSVINHRSALAGLPMRLRFHGDVSESAELSTSALCSCLAIGQSFKHNTPTVCDGLFAT